MRIEVKKIKEDEISICEHCKWFDNIIQTKESRGYGCCRNCIFYSVFSAYLDEDTSIFENSDCYIDLEQLGELFRKYLENRRAQRDCYKNI